MCFKHGLVEEEAGQHCVVFSCFSADFPQADNKISLGGLQGALAWDLRGGCTISHTAPTSCKGRQMAKTLKRARAHTHTQSL